MHPIAFSVVVVADLGNFQHLLLFAICWRQRSGGSWQFSAQVIFLQSICTVDLSAALCRAAHGESICDWGKCHSADAHPVIGCSAKCPPLPFPLPNMSVVHLDLHCCISPIPGEIIRHN